jgi:hypothetical protein
MRIFEGRLHMGLICCFALLTVFGSCDEWGIALDAKTILNSDQSIRRAFPDGLGGWWILPGGGTVIQKYDGSGNITAEFDISSFKSPMLPLNEKRILFDISGTGDGDICALVGSVQPQSREIGSYILRYGHSNPDPELILLDTKVAAFKIGIDSRGNYFLLGLDDISFWNIQRGHVSGTHKVLHKFTANGKHLGSFMPMPIDASSDDSRTRELTSPMHHPGNFVVCANGDAWLLWHSFPGEGGPNGTSPRLFKIDSKGVDSQVTAAPPADGGFLFDIVEQSDTHDVLLEWRTGRSVGGMEAVLAAPDGAVYARIDYAGRLMSVSNSEVIVAGRGAIEGKVSVSSIPLKGKTAVYLSPEHFIDGAVDSNDNTYILSMGSLSKTSPDGESVALECHDSLRKSFSSTANQALALDKYDQAWVLWSGKRGGVAESHLTLAGTEKSVLLKKSIGFALGVTIAPNQDIYIFGLLSPCSQKELVHRFSSSGDYLGGFNPFPESNPLDPEVRSRLGRSRIVAVEDGVFILSPLHSSKVVKSTFNSMDQTFVIASLTADGRQQKPVTIFSRGGKLYMQVFISGRLNEAHHDLFVYENGGFIFFKREDNAWGQILGLRSDGTPVLRNATVVTGRDRIASNVP